MPEQRLPGSAVVTLDLHGKTQYQARVALDAALRRSKGVYRLRVIHGCHNGTALREMIWREYAGRSPVLRLEADGESRTDLVLRELGSI